MKKLIAAASATLASLTYALPVFAQEVIDTCPQGGFEALCNFQGSEFGTLISSIIRILLIVAVIIAIFFLIWGGIKWIMSGGDKAKVESARNTIIGAIIGLIFAFLAFFLISLVGSLFGVDVFTLTLPQLFEEA